MAHQFAKLAFTPIVRALQAEAGSRTAYAAMDAGDDYNHEITERESSFIQQRDSFYMASVSETGWPYVQHRGGPAGFMKVLDRNRLGFADYSGNRQYVSTGNFQHDNRVALFFMDYHNRRRLKLLGRIERIDACNPSLLAQLIDEDYVATVERAFVIHVEAFDWNCPQHITPRYTAEQIHAAEAAAKRDASAPARATESQPLGNGPLTLTVAAMRQLTPSIRGFELRSPDSGLLPGFTAGAHLRIPVRLPGGELVEREYSIASSPAQRDFYEIAVLHEPAGRGGSAAIHEQFQLGTTLHTGLPINHFALAEHVAPAVLIAGGIGITPIRSMALALKGEGRSFAVHYLGRTRQDMAFLAELERDLGDRMTVHTSDHQRIDLVATLKCLCSDEVLYVCGPTRLIRRVRDVAAETGFDTRRIHFERFD